MSARYPFRLRDISDEQARVFESVAARYERFVIEIAAELVRIAEADKAVPPAGDLRDGPGEP